jgi:general secretion pathway protein G
MVLFSYRSRFFFMALILAAVIAGKLMLTKVDPGQVMLPGQSKVRQTQRELTVLRTALEWFRANCNRYPSDAEGLRALVRNPGIPGWQGHYIDGLPPDVWGHPFQYACSNNAVRLFSLGPDGAAGTPDDVPSPFPNFRELMQRINVNELPRADEPENGPAAGGP